jgi:hypothetical protein
MILSGTRAQMQAQKPKESLKKQQIQFLNDHVSLDSLLSELNQRRFHPASIDNEKFDRSLIAYVRKHKGGLELSRCYPDGKNELLTEVKRGDNVLVRKILEVGI